MSGCSACPQWPSVVTSPPSFLACAPTGKWSHQEGTSICPHVFNCISFLVYEYISPKQSHRISFETKQPGNSCLKRGFRGSKLIRISVISWLLTKKNASSFFSFRLISSQLVKVAKLLQDSGMSHFGFTRNVKLVLSIKVWFNSRLPPCNGRTANIREGWRGG